MLRKFIRERFVHVNLDIPCQQSLLLFTYQTHIIPHYKIPIFFKKIHCFLIQILLIYKVLFCFFGVLWDYGETKGEKKAPLVRLLVKSLGI